MKEYELSEVFHHSEDAQHYEVLKMEHLTPNTISVFNGNSDIEAAIEEERREQEMMNQRNYPKPITSTTTQASSSYSSTVDDRYLNTM